MTDTISILSELRSNYNCFASVDEPYYQALTEAIAAIKAERKGHWIYSENEYGIDGDNCDKCIFKCRGITSISSRTISIPYHGGEIATERGTQ